MAPNHDTLYGVGFLDLSGGPLVVNLPDSKGRYFVLQTLDAYSNIPIVIGVLLTRLSQGKLRVFVGVRLSNLSTYMY